MSCLCIAGIKSIISCLHTVNLNFYFLTIKHIQLVLWCKAWAANKKTGSSASQANIEVKIRDAVPLSGSDKLNLGSFPHGSSAIQRSTSLFSMSVCALWLDGALANVLCFGYKLWFILAVLPHPERDVPIAFLFQILHNAFRWVGLTPATWQITSTEVSAMTIITAVENIKEARGDHLKFWAAH